MHPRTGCAHAHSPAPILGPLPARQCPRASPLLPRPERPLPPASLGPLLLSEPPPSGSPRCSYLRPSSIRLSGGGPEPASSSAGPAAAGGEDAAAAPRSHPVEHLLAPGLGVRAPGPGLVPRVCGRPPAGKQEELTEEARSPPARPAAEQSEPRGAERAPRLREGTKGAGAGAGARGRGLARRGRARRARPRGSRAAGPSRQWAGGRKTQRNLVSCGVSWVHQHPP